MSSPLPSKDSFLSRVIRFCLERKAVVLLVTIFLVIWGVMSAPFDWDIGFIPRNPVPVDAIPDIGENQQIVFTEWRGRSPQDIEDQITYPLTVSLLGIPGVKTVRSYSMFGFSTIYVIFEEKIEFYWSRSRLLEKLNSLPAGTLPPGVQPALGPDATALGQIFWYTLEGQDDRGRPTGGWDLDELRSIQDWYVRYALLGAPGVSEVASVGGFVKEYQIDVDPDALRAHRITLAQVFDAVKMSNLDVGARTIEINKVEYIIRGIGFIKNLDDLAESVVTVTDNLPIRIKDVAQVTMGPALRRGVLDKGGAEVVGGVVVARFGENPLAVIKGVKHRIDEIAPGLPEKKMPDGTRSKVRVVPFYDRSGLIKETLGTLDTALSQEILITIIVVLISIMNLRSSLLISALLPMAVLLCFVAMKQFGVDANVVALSGIAIAIGTIVDMGIIVCENILNRLDESPPESNRLEVIHAAVTEVGSAVLTAVSTTVVSFLPVFTMEAAEGKLFKPLAFTKTFALLSSILIALTLLPALAHLVFRGKGDRPASLLWTVFRPVLGLTAGLGLMYFLRTRLGLVFIYLGFSSLIKNRIGPRWSLVLERVENLGVILLVTLVLSQDWLPLGPERGGALNFLFVGAIIGGVLAFLQGFQRIYRPLLSWCLNHKAAFLLLPVTVVIAGGVIWLGFGRLTSWLPEGIRRTGPMAAMSHAFPGLGKEFMPPLDEGSFLYMPTTMPHASIGQVKEILAQQDMALLALPEVEEVVGKLGRAETPLDPAPVSMIETLITYKPEFLLDDQGRRLQFEFQPETKDFFRDPEGRLVPAPDRMPYLVRGKFPRDDQGRLIPDEAGRPFRVWRPALDPAINPDRDPWPGIRKPDDIWDEIVKAADMPGVTSAPKLQPISTRIVMLQTGMRAPMGVKVKGPSLDTIEAVGLQIERFLKEVPSVEAAAVIADRIVGKPYLEIVIDRNAIARYGIMLAQVQDVIETALGGKMITTTVEKRERYPVRVRYLRELRDSIEGMKKILVAGPGGQQIPLEQLARIEYVRGPQVIKSEDTFLLGYVLFDKKPGFAEVDVVEQAAAYLKSKMADGEFSLPPGVSYAFSGSYENQIRAQKKLALILPLALFVILIILYLQFKAWSTTTMIFSGILVAWSGGFIMIWLYSQAWFLNFDLFGVSMRDLFQVHPINLSVAIWVGFLALFGIATDDGVLMATYLDESTVPEKGWDRDRVRQAVLDGAQRRIRPAMMTSATTILALLPVLTSSGRGSDIMLPMAIPSFGGMVIATLTVFVVPVLYSWVKERGLKRSRAS